MRNFMMSLMVVVVAVLCVESAQATTYLSWFKAKQKGYTLNDSPGPNLRISDANIFEGINWAATFKTDSALWYNRQEPTLYYSGKEIFFPSPAYTYDAAFLCEDINRLKGTLTKAIMRVELVHIPKINVSGTLKIIRRVMDLKQPPYNLTYSPFTGNCPFNRYSVLRLEVRATHFLDTVTIQTPQGRMDTLTPSPLLKQFWEMDVTRPFKWILANNDSGKQHIYCVYMVPIKPTGYVDTPSVMGYAFNSCDTILAKYKYPGTWTKDGNTLHFVLEGNLSLDQTASEKQGELSEGLVQVHPNPFSANLNIDNFTALGKNASIKIRDVSGRTVWSGRARGGEARAVSFVNRPAGVYLVEVNDNGRVFTKRVLCVR